MIRPPYEFDVSQRAEELQAFVDLLAGEGVRKYLEIGSYCGGSLWMIANWAMKPGDTLVTIDKPVNDRAFESLTACHHELKLRGYDTFQLTADSRNPITVHQAEEFGIFDAVFIDGDHTWEGVDADWNNYGRLGKIVAFHDVCWDNLHKPEKMQARQHWEALRERFQRTQVISRQRNAYGIGVLWR